MKRSVLIVEDDKEIRDLLAHYIHKEGLIPIPARDGEEGLAKARSEKPDLILLDIMLPKMDGLELLRKIRASGEIAHIPVAMLTAKGDETDRIVGLELGADDYIQKPFSPREVVARIKAIFRRSLKAPETIEEKVYDYYGLRMDISRHEVRFNGKAVSLTAKEFRILELFLSRPGRVLTREAILDKAWGGETHVIDRTVDVHVAKLRQKIPFLAEAIETVKDVGYRLREG